MRAVLKLPVAVHLPAAGLYSSALLPEPPTTSTWPLASSVAVCSSRGVVMLPVLVHVPEDCAATGAAGLTASPTASSPATGSARRLRPVHLCMPITSTLAARGHRAAGQCVAGRWRVAARA